MVFQWIENLIRNIFFYRIKEKKNQTYFSWYCEWDNLYLACVQQFVNSVARYMHNIKTNSIYIMCIEQTCNY